MAIRIAVTTCPRPRSLRAPNADIGATGCSTIIPYRIKSHSVSVRRNRGAAATIVFASVLTHFSLPPCKTCAIESFQSPSFCGNTHPQASANFPREILFVRHVALRPTLRIHRRHHQKERKSHSRGGLPPHQSRRRSRSGRPLPLRTRFSAPRRARPLHRLLPSSFRRRP